MRIASLVPSATEMLYALGLGDRVVGVTHECDFPPEAASETHLTRSIIPEGLEAGQIDAAVREAVGAGRALYELDENALLALEVDLIATQAVCEVCAVSYDDVRAVAARLPTRPDVISLDPSTLPDVIADVTASATPRMPPTVEPPCAPSLEERLAAVREAVAGAPRPRVLALEWLDPPFVGGHWIPEMIEAAGGTDVLGRRARSPRPPTWDELAAARPDVVVAMPCGWDAQRAGGSSTAIASRSRGSAPTACSRWTRWPPISRPGPRLVDGAEELARLLHPDLLPPDQTSGARVPAPAAATPGEATWE